MKLSQFALFALISLFVQPIFSASFDPIQVEDKPFEGVTVVFFRADQFGRRGFMLPRQIAKQAPEIGAPAQLVCGECGFRFGGQVAGSRIQAE